MSIYRFASGTCKLINVPLALSVLTLTSYTATAQTSQRPSGPPSATRSLQPSGTVTGTVANVRKDPLPDTFPEVLEKVVQAGLNNFKSLRGAPLTDSPTRVKSGYRNHVAFVWRAKTVLPGATDCFIEVDSLVFRTDDPPNDPRYACDVSSLNRTQLIKGIKAALGPDWAKACPGNSIEQSHPSSADAFVCFYTDVTEGLDRRVVLTEDGNILVQIFTWPGKSKVKVGSANELSAIPGSDDIAAAIARIETAQHLSLPSLQSGSGSGPIIIQNDTSSMLTIYISGGVNNTAVIPPSGQMRLSIRAGRYKVAGELSDKSVIPFFGLRNYSGGETELFYVGKR